MGVAKSAEPFVCGGSAATFASVIIHPMDLAKVRHRCSIVILVCWAIATRHTVAKNSINVEDHFSSPLTIFLLQ